MKIHTATAALLIKPSCEPYPDASGFPVVITCGPYVFACDIIGGEVRVAAIRDVNGMRVARKVAVERCTAAYTKLLLDRTDDDWRVRNVEVYA